jgi:hypothetical protein
MKQDTKISLVVGLGFAALVILLDILGIITLTY